jgi:hypothetical protein
LGSCRVECKRFDGIVLGFNLSNHVVIDTLRLRFQTFIQTMIREPFEWLVSLPSSIAEQGILAAFIGAGPAAAFFGIQALSESWSDFESMMRSQSFEGLVLDAERVLQDILGDWLPF